MVFRKGKLQPWYHVPRPQCDTITLAKERCLFSAKYTDRKTETIHLCKTHADMQCDIGGERAIKEEHRNWLNLDLRINTPTGSFTVGIDLCPRHAMEFLNPAEGAFQLHGLSVSQFLIDPTMKWEQLPLPEKGR